MAANLPFYLIFRRIDQSPVSVSWTWHSFCLYSQMPLLSSASKRGWRVCCGLLWEVQRGATDCCEHWLLNTDCYEHIWLWSVNAGSSTRGAFRSRRTSARRCVTSRSSCVTTRTRAWRRCECGATLSDWWTASDVWPPVMSLAISPTLARPQHAQPQQQTMTTDLCCDGQRAVIGCYQLRRLAIHSRLAERYWRQTLVSKFVKSTRWSRWF